MHALVLMVSLVALPNLALPQGFVYLADVAPTIVQDMRYANVHNFTGGKVPGYEAERCILTAPTAEALRQAQQELVRFGLGIKVYDCYRPKAAVDHFAQWAQQANGSVTKAEFFPDLHPSALHAAGYIAHRSGHSRGSTVDLTLVPLPIKKQPPYVLGEPQTPCTAPYGVRWPDNSLDMGTGYDCFDARAHTENEHIAPQARIHRLLLRATMRRYGMINYPKEWWHFTYFNEPFRTTSFSFPVR